MYRLASFTPNVSSSRRVQPESNLPWNTDTYSGWGGHQYHNTDPGISHPPIIFVHGNERDASDWEIYADRFLARGCSGDELWAITFSKSTPTHDEIASELDSFVQQVRRETGSDTVSIVAHSLGVTGARYWLEKKNRYPWMSSFVGIAGANHGTYACAFTDIPGFRIGRFRPSDSLNAMNIGGDTENIVTDLNEGTETPGDVEYYTVRARYDPYFAMNPSSPCLEGAEENLAVACGHDRVRVSSKTVRAVHSWLVEECCT